MMSLLWSCYYFFGDFVIRFWCLFDITTVYYLWSSFDVAGLFFLFVLLFGGCLFFW